MVIPSLIWPSVANKEKSARKITRSDCRLLENQTWQTQSSEAGWRPVQPTNLRYQPMRVSWFHYIGHIFKGFTAKAIRDYSESHPLHVSEPQRGLELRFEDPVFGDKIPITQKEFLVHCPGYVGQNTHPPHKTTHRRLELISKPHLRQNTKALGHGL